MLMFSRWLTGGLLVILMGGVGLAHNNPTFREDLLITVAVDASAGGVDGMASETFSLDWPKKTVQLIWRIKADAPADASFDVSQHGETVLRGLTDGTLSNRLQGNGFAITGVKADRSFLVEIYAKVLDRREEN